MTRQKWGRGRTSGLKTRDPPAPAARAERPAPEHASGRGGPEVHLAGRPGSGTSRVGFGFPSLGSRGARLAQLKTRRQRAGPEARQPGSLQPRAAAAGSCAARREGRRLSPQSCALGRRPRFGPREPRRVPGGPAPAPPRPPPGPAAPPAQSPRRRLRSVLESRPCSSTCSLTYSADVCCSPRKRQAPGMQDGWTLPLL